MQHNRGSSHGSSRVEKRFYTISSALQVDSTFEYQPEDPPPLSPHFRKAIANRNHSHPDGLKDQAWFMLKNFPFFLQSATLGSQRLEIRSMAESALSSFRKKTGSDSVAMSANALFVKNSGGVQSAWTDEEQMNELEAISHRSDRVIGGNFDGETRTFPLTERPGLLSAIFKSSCSLIKEEDNPELKDACEDMAKSSSMCLTPLPDITSVRYSSS